MSSEQQVFYHLGVALVLGLLIGVERGWRERQAEEGTRIAGVRTYALIGLLGGVLALLSGEAGMLVLTLGFVALAGILVAVYIVTLQRRGDIGITSLIAGLLTFVFGALAGRGQVGVAAAATVLTMLVLSYKPQMHRWIGAIDITELRAGIKLLLISVVLLPVLPDRGFGPWQALNPYTLWWMVVLIALISFVGYFAIRIGGPGKGTVFTGLFSGLASSTALTLHFSRMARRDPQLVTPLATGILLACGTMVPRMLLVASVINRSLFRPLLLPGLIMAVLVYLPALWFWRQQKDIQHEESAPLQNPLELIPALSFGALLAVVMLLSKALNTWLGEGSVLMLAAVSGVSDVDAITLSLSRMSGSDLTLHVTVAGIVIAAAVNSVVKAGLAAVIGGRQLAVRAGLPLLASAAGGLLAVWLFVY